jgi:hypothetical protein
MRVQAFRRIALAAASMVLFFSISAPGFSGEICMQWEPVQGASGYRVYYGPSSGSYSNFVDVGNDTHVDLEGFSDCTTYYLAVKAYNAAGESVQFSNEISGWARPEISSYGPSVMAQGDQVILSIAGANFRSGAELLHDTADIPVDADGTPLVRFENISVLSCNQMQAVMTVEPTARGVRAMEIGDLRLDFSVRNPDAIYGSRAVSVEITFDEARSDINRSDTTTADRVDGKDLIWLAYAYGSRESEPYYNPDADLDGDGLVDGMDLAYLAASFGMCWNGTAWSTHACN